ncbi:MAG: glycosyltransferase family 2 protein [Bacteroidales bacterium]|jgi:glycosyltransferase involved in cell wall biosynthesis
MKWSKKYLKIYEKSYSSIPDEIFDRVKENVIGVNDNPNPKATVGIITYNDETRLLSCIWSLSENKSKYPFEIIGINNRSKDHSEEIFRRTSVPCYNESRKGCSAARQCGLDNAKGKYYICIDSDTIYPPNYVDMVVSAFEKNKSVGVNVRYSLIYHNNKDRIKYFCYEFFRNIFNRLVSIKRPELAVRGFAFSINAELGRKVGYKINIIRGEDGSMARGLLNYGKIKFIRHNRYKPLTRTTIFDSSFSKKIFSEIKNIKRYFKRPKVVVDQDSNIIKDLYKD